MPIYKTPFDPPDPSGEATLTSSIWPGDALDPRERIRQGFQQLRVEDRRMDSPMNWLTQRPVFRDPFNPPESPYDIPQKPVKPETYTSYLINSRLSTALGAEDLDRAYNKKLQDRVEALQKENKEMEEFNKRLRERREAGARKK